MTSISLQAGLSELEAWLDAHAEAIDTEQELASEILPRLGRAGKDQRQFAVNLAPIPLLDPCST